MGCEEIINLIWEENALDAKKALEDSLYERAAYALRDIAPDSSRRSFRDQNACPDHVILGEAEKSPEQKAFQALFDKILKKHGVDSPNELEDSKKDDFFNEVEREWKKDPANTPEKNESVNEQDDPRYVTTPMRMPKRRPNPLFGQPGGADTPFKIPMGIPYLPRPEVGEPGGPAGPPQPKPYMPGGPRPTRPAYSEPGPDSRRMSRPVDPFLPKPYLVDPFDKPQHDGPSNPYPSDVGRELGPPVEVPPIRDLEDLLRKYPDLLGNPLAT